MKKCPYCAEDIKSEAIICKHCHVNLEEGVKEHDVPSAMKTIVRYAVAALILWFIFSYFDALLTILFK